MNKIHNTLKWTVMAALATGLTACSDKDNYDATGSFEATEVTISAEYTGQLLDFTIEEGDTIKQGQQIGAIDSMQLYLKKLQLRKNQKATKSNQPDITAQAASINQQIAHLQTEKKRIENLLKDGASTKKALDDVNAQIRISEGQLTALKSTLQKNTQSINESSSAIAVQIAAIDDQLKHCRITSPIAGTILNKYMENGEYATMGRQLVRVADLQNMYLRAYFTSEQLANIELGQEVNVTADYGNGKNYTYKGKVTWISAESEFTPKNIQTSDTRGNNVYAVKIAVKNDGNLKIGVFGGVTLSEAKSESK